MQRVSRGVIVLAFAVQMASANAIFRDDFQSGSLSSARWANVGSAVVVNDPTLALNKVLSFTNTASGGDLFGIILPHTVDTYLLSFDFYETQAADFITQIGYFGTDHQTFASVNEQWFWNAGSVTPGQWTHFSFTMTPLTTSPFNLKLENASQNPGSASPSPIYFDNIVLDDLITPEPATIWLCGIAISGLAIRRRLAGARL